MSPTRSWPSFRAGSGNSSTTPTQTPQKTKKVFRRMGVSFTVFPFAKTGNDRSHGPKRQPSSPT